PIACPKCGSVEVHARKTQGDWLCTDCLHAWHTADDAEGAQTGPRARIFLSYGRGDAAELAGHLEQDLTLYRYDVVRDTREIRKGQHWEEEIVDGLRSTQLVVALLSPHAVRRRGRGSHDDLDGVCLDELSFARFACKTPIVPVMAVPCEPPFVVFRL